MRENSRLSLSKTPHPFVYQTDCRPPPRQVAAQFLVGASAGVLVGAVAGVLACAAIDADFRLLEGRIRAARRNLEEGLPTWLQDEDFILATHHLFIPRFPQFVDRRKAAAAEAQSPKERLKSTWNLAVETGTRTALELTGLVPPRTPP